MNESIGRQTSMNEANDIPRILRQGADRIRRAARETQALVPPRLLELADEFERQAELEEQAQKKTIHR